MTVTKSGSTFVLALFWSSLKLSQAGTPLNTAMKSKIAPSYMPAKVLFSVLKTI